MIWNQYQLWLKDVLVSKWHEPAFAPPEPNSFSTDSRIIKRGDFFVPLAGETFDGHKFVAQSLEKGAVGFFYATQSKHLVPEALFSKGIEVVDTLKALQHIATGWREEVGLNKLIALTGSVGKTTTKEMLLTILRAHGPTMASVGSFNNEIGVPLTLLRLIKEHKTAALEFGARHQGDIKFLTELARPNIVALLNVKKVHISEFKNIETIYETKSEIFRNSGPDTILVAYHDDEKILKLAQATKKKLISFGNHQDSTVQIKDAVWNRQGSMSINLVIKKVPVLFQLPSSHESYPINLAAACALAYAAGVEVSTMTKSLADFSGADGRFQTINTGKLLVIDDSYNANPESMAAGIRTCKKLYPDKKTIAILGDMKELGDDSAKMHLAIGALCFKEMDPDLLITVGKDGEKIAEGATKAGLRKDKILCFGDVNEVTRLPDKIFLKRELIFLKASHSMEFRKIVEALRKLK